MTNSVLFAFTLSDANRWAGVLMAFIGSIVVAPNGTALLWRSTPQWIMGRRRWLEVQVRRLVPFLHRRTHSISGSVKGTATSTGTLTATVTAASWDPAAPQQEQITVLYRHIVLAEARLDLASDQQGQETRTRERQVSELKQALREDIAELHRLLEEKDQEGARIDARGLPVIGFGIVLSGIPDELAAIPLGLGWIIPIVGLCVGIGVAWSSWHARRAIT